jgi:hypothetical protein
MAATPDLSSLNIFDTFLPSQLNPGTHGAIRAQPNLQPPPRGARVADQNGKLRWAWPRRSGAAVAGTRSCRHHVGDQSGRPARESRPCRLSELAGVAVQAQRAPAGQGGAAAGEGSDPARLGAARSAPARGPTKPAPCGDALPVPGRPEFAGATPNASCKVPFSCRRASCMKAVLRHGSSFTRVQLDPIFPKLSPSGP